MTPLFSKRREYISLRSWCRAYFNGSQLKNRGGEAATVTSVSSARRWASCARRGSERPEQRTKRPRLQSAAQGVDARRGGSEQVARRASASTSPMVKAWVAGIRSAVRNICSAAACPTRRGKRCVPPQPVNQSQGRSGMTKRRIIGGHASVAGESQIQSTADRQKPRMAAIRAKGIRQRGGTYFAHAPQIRTPPFPAGRRLRQSPRPWRRIGHWMR